MNTRTLLACAGALLLTACGEPDSDCEIPEISPASIDPGADILAQLQSIPMVTFVEERAARYSDMQLFVMELEQPLNHCDPGGRKFSQFASLLFRDRDAPVAFATNGYAVGRNPARSEPAALLTGNQLQVEHRFFGTSVPADFTADDWQYLDIFQAATDHHRIARTFSGLLSGEWVSTGASKGGMTALFHRYFYPDDVSATVAYVAPETIGLRDERYVTFLENVGEASCRDALKAFQRGVLERRAEMEDALADYGIANGFTFETFGLEQGLEFAVLESSFAFWQYGEAAMCAEIPGPDAPAEELLSFMDLIGVLSFLDDFALEYYAPYFYQSATQLGGPAYPQAHLLDLNGGEPIPDYVENYPPFGVTKTFDPAVMPAIHEWVKNESERFLFVYGQNDPWTAGAYEPNTAGDSHLFTVPGGNHGSNISALPEPDRTAALDVLSGWVGVAPPAPERRLNFDPLALHEARAAKRLDRR